MKTSTNKRLGALLLVGAALAAVAVQIIGDGLITIRSLPMPAAMPGQIAPSSVTEAVYHWPLFVLALLALVGLVYILLPPRHEHVG